MPYRKGAIASRRLSVSALLPWLIFAWLFANGAPGSAWAMEEWQQDFNEICVSTQEAEALAPEALGKLVSRCDALRNKIEQLGEERNTERKVYLKRLDMCRGLYDYVLRMKEQQ